MRKVLFSMRDETGASLCGSTMEPAPIVLPPTRLESVAALLCTECQDKVTLQMHAPGRTHPHICTLLRKTKTLLGVLAEPFESM